MNKSYEVEYCNLDLRFDRRTIHNFIKSLIQEGYSLYWSENESYFIVSIRSARRLVKLKFQRIGDRFKMVGNYSFRDEKLVEIMERMIGATRGHAVVKRFRERQIVIENIMFGEIIRMVEISGVEHKVVFQRERAVTLEDIAKAYRSKRAEERIPVLRLEIDYELATLSDALAEGDEPLISETKARLEALRKEMLLLEA
ncbi:hypothetical protein [Paenibacillus thermotolerans]|uniref:hypothetical protein n=1 Tax=Paenibacillus thermotolerans TaxID=3027807 RepID=UPI002368AFD9|nr:MULTISPECIES: hypothetical protein [unclassified Paenibacillus]